MMKKDRSRRRERGEAVSSSDEEQDSRRVEAEMLGMARQARRLVDSRRRNRGESEQLESLLMDSEVVRHALIDEKNQKQLLVYLRQNTNDGHLLCENKNRGYRGGGSSCWR